MIVLAELPPMTTASDRVVPFKEIPATEERFFLFIVTFRALIIYLMLFSSTSLFLSF